MKKAAALTVTMALAAVTLAGCGGDSEYCASVKENVAVLDSFGKKKTDSAFQKYRRTTNTIAKLAPAPVDKDWKALGKSLIDVRDAQKTAGLTMQKTTAEAVAGLSTLQSTGLSSAYEDFTEAVADHGTKIKDQVKDECGVTLK